MEKGKLELHLEAHVDNTKATKTLEELANQIGHVEESLYHLENILHRIYKIPIELSIEQVEFTEPKKSKSTNSYWKEYKGSILIGLIVGAILGIISGLSIPFPF